MSAIKPYVFANPQLQRIASSLLAAKQYEGEGRIIHDSYTKSDYTSRRLWFLGNHPDFESIPQLLPKINREAHQVFESQADELSVERVRARELALQVEPLLPLPTHTNTDTLDNFQGTGEKEWTHEIGHPVFAPSLEQSPKIPATETLIQDFAFPGSASNAALELGESISDEHIKASAAGQGSTPYLQTITAGPNTTLSSHSQQTTTNMAVQLHPFSYARNHHLDPTWPSAMDQPKVALNLPENSDVMNQITNALRAPVGSLMPSDAPLQYQDTVQYLQSQQIRRPLHEVSSVMGRSMSTPVKTHSSVKTQSNAKKHSLPVEEDADANASGEDRAVKLPAKRCRVAQKKPRELVTAGEDPTESSEPARAVNETPGSFSTQEVPVQVEKPTARRPVAKQPREAPAVGTKAKSKASTKIKVRKTTRATSSAASSASAPVPAKKGSQRPVLGGKSLPIPATTTAAAAPARSNHTACVNGTRMARSRKEADEAALERKQVLLTDLLSRHPTTRHPDLLPEFFDTANFTRKEKDPNGAGVVRCVCGNNTDGDNYGGDWIGCDNEDCGVWQHVKCMGEAVPVTTKARQNEKYLCQQCDPLAHRRLIMALRKEHPLPPT